MRAIVLAMIIAVSTLTPALALQGGTGAHHNGPPTGCDKYVDTCSKKNETYKASHPS